MHQSDPILKNNAQDFPQFSSYLKYILKNNAQDFRQFSSYLKWRNQWGMDWGRLAILYGRVLQTTQAKQN